MARTVRVKLPPCVLRHPDDGHLTVPNPAQPYDADDPLVLAYPWQFQADADRSGGIEQATAAPGERRPTYRGR